MTLTVTLAAPYANFAAVAGFQLFFPMPTAVDDLDDQTEWENGVMIGNGPFMLEAAAHRPGDRPRAERRVGRRHLRQRPSADARQDHLQ